MSSISNLDSDRRFKRYVQYSVAAHVALFLFFTVKTAFFTDEPIMFQNAVRVDMVALPDKMMTDLPPAPQSAAPEKKTETPKPTPPPVAQEKVQAKKEPLPPKPKDPDAINLDKSKNKQKDALAKLKQMEALEAIQNDIQSEQKKKAQEAVRNYKGNALSAGTELTGVNKMQADSYIGEVHKHVKMNWAMPEYLRKRQLEATVLIKVDSNGLVLAKNIVKSSGNPVFDDGVIAAVDRSSPFPRPPEKFEKIFAVQGFLFRFSE